MGDEDIGGEDVALLTEANNNDDFGIPLNIQRDGGDEKDKRYALMDQALQDIGMGKYQYFALVTTGMGTFIDASETALISILFPLLQDAWGVSYEDLALVSSMTALGMMFGAPILGKVSDFYGRRPVYMLSLFFVATFGLLSSFATNIQGVKTNDKYVCKGGNSISGVTLMLETMPHENRSQATAIHAFSWGLGAVFIAGIGMAANSIGWQWLVRIPSIVAIPLLVSMWMVPESARFFISRNRHAEAVDVMTQMARRNKKPMPRYFNEANLNKLFIVQKYGKVEPESLVYEDFTVEESTIRADYKLMTRWCCHKAWLSTIIPLCTVWFLNSAGSTIFGWIPLAISNLNQNTTSGAGNSTGGGQPSQATFNSSLLMAGGNLCGCVLLFLIGPKFQRTTLLRAGLFICSMLIFLLSFTATSLDALYSVSFFALLFFQISINMLYLYTPELMPTEIRSFYFGVCVTFNRLAHVVAPYLIASIAKTNFPLACFVFAFFFLGAFMVSLVLRRKTLNVPMVESSDYKFSKVE